MPEISQHSYDIAVVAVRRDHTSGVSVLKVYRPWYSLTQKPELFGKKGLIIRGYSF